MKQKPGLAKTAEDRAVVRKRILRACTNREIRAVLLEVIDKTTATIRLTTSGIIIYGPEGACGTHWTVSEARASKNLRASLRRIGVLD